MRHVLVLRSAAQGFAFLLHGLVQLWLRTVDFGGCCFSSQGAMEVELRILSVTLDSAMLDDHTFARRACRDFRDAF